MEERLRVKPGSSSWRENNEFFYREKEFTYQAGAVNFALAWFQQAMEVSAVFRWITDRLTDDFFRWFFEDRTGHGSV